MRRAYNIDMTRWVLVVVVLLLGGCASWWELPDPRTVETPAHRLVVPPERLEYMSSPVVAYEDTGEYLEAMELEGWRLFSFEQAGKFFPQHYIITLSRPAPH